MPTIRSNKQYPPPPDPQWLTAILNEENPFKAPAANESMLNNPECLLPRFPISDRPRPNASEEVDEEHPTTANAESSTRLALADVAASSNVEEKKEEPKAANKPEMPDAFTPIHEAYKGFAQILTRLSASGVGETEVKLYTECLAKLEVGLKHVREQKEAKTADDNGKN